MHAGTLEELGDGTEAAVADEASASTTEARVNTTVVGLGLDTVHERIWACFNCIKGLYIRHQPAM